MLRQDEASKTVITIACRHAFELYNYWKNAIISSHLFDVN